MPVSSDLLSASLPVCTRQGERAILCDVGPSPDTPLDLDVQRKVWAVSAHLAACPEVLEVITGMNNLLVVFRHQPHLDTWRALVHEAWLSRQTTASNSRELIVPVIYGGPSGQDLDYVANRVGLTSRQYVDLHAQAIYVVYALGSQPGFAYLGGLDPRLAVERRHSPRPRVEAGAVIIGGAQAGILSRTSPSGWHIIGKTNLNCFDHTRQRPALLAPGDTVRFEVKDFLG